MKRRKGKTTTFSVSIDLETKRLLKDAAARAHGGNVSALITELAHEAARRAAAAAFLESVGSRVMTSEEADAFEASIARELAAQAAPAPAPRARRLRRRAA